MEDGFSRLSIPKKLRPKSLIKKNPVVAKVKKIQDKRKHKEGSRDSYPLVHFNNEELNSQKSNNFPSNTFTTSKYTLFSFPFKVLWEQFSKATTLYFTSIVIISLIPQISPITPYTSIMGLAFILVVAAVREGWEDFLRHKADRKVNQRRYQLVEPGSDGERVVTRSRWLAVGDLVYVKCDQQIPADLVVLVTSDPDGVAYIETSQLDGETNLKVRRAPIQTCDMELGDIAKIQGTVECEAPHHQLYVFKATMKFAAEPDNPIPLDQGNLLLQSAFLRNTEWALGIVVYAGPETKLSLNQKKPPTKLSKLDKRLNWFVYGLFFINLLLCTAMAILAGFFEWKFVPTAWYLPEDTEGPWIVGVKVFFAYFALLSYLIPLSLVVSLEMVKVLQARFMEWDEQMVKEGEGMTVKTSNLNDELGLVQYVFSDKTGTLTENQMDFMKCSVNGLCYDNDSLNIIMAQRGEEADNVRNFVLAMALAQSAVTDTHKKTGALIYKASSPDEEALCHAASAHGLTFLSRANKGVTIKDERTGEETLYEILCLMEFTSERRRMSVIFRCPDGSIKLFSKGADTTIYERLAEGQNELKAKTLNDLDQFSKDGLRTLAYAEKYLSEEGFHAWYSKYQAASNLLEGREEEVENLCDIMERDLKLIGCSAIEDKLQEGVPETIHYLLEAGMRVWVITGDKQATAINIGYSSKLLSSEMRVVKINAESPEECRMLLRREIRRIKGKDFVFPEKKKTVKISGRDYEEISDPVEDIEDSEGGEVIPGQQVACVIDGATLKYALKDCAYEFVTFATCCHSVICNRVTPLQKAKVVRLIKNECKAVCLSIGDGANDVSMIQEANIGVGIYGKEGNQAARASDFALRQFSHLRRLICVHGRYSMIRNAFLIHYSFYKNTAVFLCQIWFAFFSGFSGQTLYDDWIMTFFNITITALPPLAVGVFEKDISDTLIERYPKCYERTQTDRLFTLRTLSNWLLSAVYQSLVIFFGTYLLFYIGFERGGVGYSGQETGFYAMGNVAMMLGMCVIFAKMIFHVHNWNWLVHLCVYFSFLIYFLTLVLENVIVSWFPHQFFVFFYLCGVPSFYLWILVGTVICLLPDIFFKFFRRAFYPHNWQILQEMDYQGLPLQLTGGDERSALAVKNKFYGSYELSTNGDGKGKEKEGSNAIRKSLKSSKGGSEGAQPIGSYEEGAFLLKGFAVGSK